MNLKIGLLGVLKAETTWHVLKCFLIYKAKIVIKLYVLVKIKLEPLGKPLFW